jgi:hypothetical protein
VTVRLAGAEEQELVELLTELDSAEPLTGRTLLAFVDGWPVAALSLHDGRIVATPFAPTVQAVAMLRLRAEQLEPGSSRRGRRGRPSRPLVRRRLRAA